MHTEWLCASIRACCWKITIYANVADSYWWYCLLRHVPLLMRFVCIKFYVNMCWRCVEYQTLIVDCEKARNTTRRMTRDTCIKIICHFFQVAPFAYGTGARFVWLYATVQIRIELTPGAWRISSNAPLSMRCRRHMCWFCYPLVSDAEFCAPSKPVFDVIFCSWALFTDLTVLAEVKSDQKTTLIGPTHIICYRCPCCCSWVLVFDSNGIFKNYDYFTACSASVHLRAEHIWSKIGYHSAV